MESPRALNTWGYLLGNPLGQGYGLSILVSPGHAGRSEPACGRWGWGGGGQQVWWSKTEFRREADVGSGPPLFLPGCVTSAFLH